MEWRFSKRCLAFIALCGCLALGSCSRQGLAAEDPDDGYGPQPWDDSPVIMLHIGTLNSGRQDPSGVQEKIRSLRIIMMHEADGNRYIEANRLIDVPDDTDPGDFSYIFQKRTVAGKKSFYLVANEESIEKVTLKATAEGDSSFPEGLGEAPSLTQFLNAFDPAMPTGDDDGDAADAMAASAGAEFEDLLGRLCFEPMRKSCSGQEKVYLPYSAYYHSGFDITPEDSYEVDRTDSPMYLVPIATKFFFKFINYRSEQVEIDYLALEKTNKSNYLMAKFENKELFVRDNYTGKELQWINWMQVVSAALQDAENDDDLASMNGYYGWIFPYQVPYPEEDEDCDAITYPFVGEVGEVDDPETPDQTTPQPWIIPAGNGDDEPAPPQEFGPFYLPEGHNMELSEESNTKVERYNLAIHMHDVGVVDPQEAKTEISNLKALFRNTSVRITITLRAGGVRIFARVEPWEEYRFNGYVKDEDDIK